MPGFAKIWTDHLPDKDKKMEFEKYVRNCPQLLDRLLDIVSGFEARIDRVELGEDYSSPSWAMVQADRIGQIKAYKQIKQLLDLKDK